MTHEVLAHAKHYTQQGFYVVPVPRGNKKPVMRNWTELRLREEQLQKHFSNGCNIGLLLGASGIVDVDCDDPLARELAPSILPPTAMRHGRASAHGSHYFYRLSGETLRPRKFRDGDCVLVEIRFGNQQTVIPPSVHPSGETLEWEDQGEPADVDPAEITERVSVLAATTLLTRYWPPQGSHQRHDFALALAGFLSRHEVDRALCVDLIERAATAAGDEEADDRVRAVRDTYESLESGKTVTGLPTLVELVGERVARKLTSSLELWLRPTVECKENAAVPVGARAAPFPVEVLPPALAEYVTECARVFGCPPDFFGVAMLTVGATAIGGSRALRVKSSWSESPRLYATIVQPPGSLKTPALKHVATPLYETQDAAYAAWRDAMETHEFALQRFDKELKEWKKEKSTTAEPPRKPEPPVLPRLFTADATVEALAPILQDNPRGVLLLRDELVGWVRSLNQYKGGHGADRQFFLSTWSGEPLVVDRKGKDPIMVRKPCLSVLGGMTPDMLGELCDERGREDGFLHRVLFSYPEEAPAPRWSEQSVPAEVERSWQKAFDFLESLHGTHDEDGYSPVYVDLAPEAQVVWKKFHDDLSDQVESGDLPAELRGPYSKLRGYCLRFALILHELQRACGDEGAHDERPVDLRAMAGACDLVDYFQHHMRRVYRQLKTDPMDKSVSAALRWIQGQGGKVTLRELVRNNVAGLKRASDAKQLAKELQDRGLAKLEKKLPGSKGGRPSDVVALIAAAAPVARSAERPFEGNGS